MVWEWNNVFECINKYDWIKDIDSNNYYKWNIISESIMRADWIKLSYSNRVFEWNTIGEYVLDILIELLANIVTNTVNELRYEIVINGLNEA